MKSKHLILLYIMILTFSPGYIYAYLDPGTGAVLFNLLLAGIATSMFFLKGAIFKLFGNKGAVKDIQSSAATISLFSEGCQYWTTFQPLVEALVENEIRFKYFTLDVRDPGLLIESDLMQAKFLGYGKWAMAKAGNISSDIMVSTTPNIGSPEYPIRKSPRVKEMIHVLHSINDISWYKNGSLDYYDSVILGGEYQAEAIIALETKRGLTEKHLIALGLPYLDTLVQEKTEGRDNNAKTILIGPSWGTKGLLRAFGTGFIAQLAASGYEIIIRPHPQSLKSEPELISKCRKELIAQPSISWDTSLSPTESMNKSDLLISDTSALRFDYAFIYEKPVITLEIPMDETPGFERDDLDSIWMDTAAKEIGIVIAKEHLDNIESNVKDALENYNSASISSFRDSVLSNYGHASEAIASYLKKRSLEYA